MTSKDLRSYNNVEVNMKNNNVCDCNVIHDEAVKNATENMPSQEEKNKVAKIFKMLGDPTRMNIMFTLLEGEMCVCDISAVLNMTKSAISHQLALLKEAKLVRFERRGKEVYYSVDDKHVLDIISETIKHVKHN